MARKSTSKKKKTAETSKRERWCADEIKALFEARSTGIAERNERKSPLFAKLSGELLNSIYRYAVVTSEPIDITVHGALTSSGLPGQPRILNAPPLALVCRRLYKEVTPIYSAENDFRLTVPPVPYVASRCVYYMPNGVQHFRRLLADSASALTELTMRPGDFDRIGLNTSVDDWDGRWWGWVRFSLAPSLNPHSFRLELTHHDTSESPELGSGDTNKLCACWFTEESDGTGTSLLDLVERYAADLTGSGLSYEYAPSDDDDFYSTDPRGCCRCNACSGQFFGIP